MEVPKLLLTTSEAARALGICRTKLYQMLANGEVPGVIRMGKSVRISLKALEEWIDQQVK